MQLPSSTADNDNWPLNQYMGASLVAELYFDKLCYQYEVPPYNTSAYLGKLVMVLTPPSYSKVHAYRGSRMIVDGAFGVTRSRPCFCSEPPNIRFVEIHFLGTGRPFV